MGCCKHLIQTSRIGVAVTAAFLTFSMVTTVSPYSNPRNRAYPGEGFDGVVRVSYNGASGTGVLLGDGRAVLTAAHLFANGTTEAASVYFETLAGSQTLASSRITLLPDYDRTNGNGDLALVFLSSFAPVTANRYTIYRDKDELGKTVVLVGYGQPGTGDAGTLIGYSGSPLRIKASNQFDIDPALLKSRLGAGMSWTPQAGTQWLADFDNGSNNQDALGALAGTWGAGLGQDEGLIAPGDSGGPAFINGRVAGIASYTARLSQGNLVPDIDSQANSSFGEIASWQRVSYYQQWLDQSARANYPNAPTSAGAVQRTVGEGNSGTTYAYFLLQFTGKRADASQWLSVDYTTRNGTAQAGSDYLATSGKLVLYPGETQAVIVVEILGDTLPEPDETFYLDVNSPVGGSFGPGVVQLTAMRTITNDDGGFWG